MDTFFRFVYEFLLQFFSPIIGVITSLISGIGDMFNFSAYVKIVNFYKNDFKGAEWIMVVLAILIVLIVLAGLVLLIVFLVKKYARFRKTIVEQESLLEEVANLNNEV